MSVHDWRILLWQQLKETDALQWLAVIFGIAEVLLAKANKIWLYPAGIAATLLSVYILLQAGLYAESLLNAYYVVMSFYGWWYWVKKKNKPAVKISYCTRKDWAIVFPYYNNEFCIPCTCTELLYSIHCSCLGCMGKRNCMGRHVAAFQT